MVVLRHLDNGRRAQTAEELQYFNIVAHWRNKSHGVITNWNVPRHDNTEEFTIKKIMNDTVTIVRREERTVYLDSNKKTTHIVIHRDDGGYYPAMVHVVRSVRHGESIAIIESDMFVCERIVAQSSELMKMKRHEYRLSIQDYHVIALIIGTMAGAKLNYDNPNLDAVKGIAVSHRGDHVIIINTKFVRRPSPRAPCDLIVVTDD